MVPEVVTQFSTVMSLSPQGVQAQTVANFYLAFEAELTIIPVMNKIDLKVARPDVVTKQMENLFDFHRDEILRVSAMIRVTITVMCIVGCMG